MVADGSKAGHCFHLLFLFFFFFYAFCLFPPIFCHDQKEYLRKIICLGDFFSFFPLLLFTHFRETPVAEILFPPIFWHAQKEYKKKWYIYIFLMSVFGRGSLNQPQSLEYLYCNQAMDAFSSLYLNIKLHCVVRITIFSLYPPPQTQGLHTKLKLRMSKMIFPLV